LTDAYSSAYPNIIDGITLVNNGVVDMTGDTNLQTVNGGLFINNRNITTNGGTFNDNCVVINNGFMFVTSNSNGNLTNNGELINYNLDDTSSANYGDDLVFGDNVIFTSTSVILMHLYGNAGTEDGEENPNYDLIEFYDTDSCVFGGTLLLDFVQPIKVPGEEYAPYVPVVGEQYPLITMPENDNTGSPIGGCECQFDAIQTIGLDTTKFSVGILWDQSDGDVEAVLAYIVICDVGDVICSSIERIGAPCGPSASSAGGSSSTTHKTATATGSTGAAGLTSTTHKSSSASSTTSSDNLNGSTSTQNNYFLFLLSIFCCIFLVLVL